MNAYDFVQLSLLALGSQIRGKTKLQKTMYFLGLLTDSLDDLGYRPHYYGPYSQEVADAVNQLVSLGFVKQSFSGSGQANEYGFESGRYDYQLTDQGREIAGSKAKGPYSQAYVALKEAAERLQTAGELNYMDLSVAAKTYFMLGQKKGSSTIGELAKLAANFGWNVDREQLRRAADYLQKLDLIELSPIGGK